MSTLAKSIGPGARRWANYFNRARVLDTFASERGTICIDASRMSHRLSTEFVGTKTPVNIRHMLASVGTNMIWEIVFCQPSPFIDATDFAHPFPMALDKAQATSHWNSNFPWLIKLLHFVPESLIFSAWPAMRSSLSSTLMRVLWSLVELGRKGADHLATT